MASTGSKTKARSKSKSSTRGVLFRGRLLAAQGLNRYAIAVFLVLFAGVGGYAVYDSSHAATSTPEVQLAMSGGKYCLDDHGDGLGKTGAPNIVDSWDCNGSAAQQWTWSGPDTGANIKINGQCLDVYRSGTVNGTVVDLFPCTGGRNQLWQKYGETLVAVQADKCLDAPGSRPYLQLDIWSCDFGDNQYWTWTNYVPTTASGAPVTESSSSTSPLPTCNADYSNKPCWPATPAQPANNPFVPAPGSTSTPSSTIPPTTSTGTAATGTSSTQSSASGSNSSSSSSGNVILQNSAASSTSSPSAVSGGPVSTVTTTTGAYNGVITSGVPGKCLDDFHDQLTAGNKVDSYTCNNSSSQSWTITTSVGQADLHHISIHNQCLFVAGSGTTSGDKVELEPCSSQTQSFWAQVGDTLQDNGPLSGQMCLSNPGSQTANGTQLVVQTCNGSAAQVWTLPPSTAHTAADTVAPVANASTTTTATSSTTSVDPLTSLINYIKSLF